MGICPSQQEKTQGGSPRLENQKLQSASSIRKNNNLVSPKRSTAPGASRTSSVNDGKGKAAPQAISTGQGQQPAAAKQPTHAQPQPKKQKDAKKTKGGQAVALNRDMERAEEQKKEVKTDEQIRKEQEEKDKYDEEERRRIIREKLPQVKKRVMQHNLEDDDDVGVFHETVFEEKEKFDKQNFESNYVVDLSKRQWWSPNSISDILNSKEWTGHRKKTDSDQLQGELFARAADEFVQASGANCIFQNLLPTDQSNRENLKLSKWMIRKTIDNALMQTMVVRSKVARKQMDIDMKRGVTNKFLRQYTKQLVKANTNVMGHQLGSPEEGDECGCRSYLEQFMGMEQEAIRLAQEEFDKEKQALVEEVEKEQRNEKPDDQDAGEGDAKDSSTAQAKLNQLEKNYAAEKKRRELTQLSKLMSDKVLEQYDKTGGLICAPVIPKHERIVNKILCKTFLEEIRYLESQVYQVDTEIMRILETRLQKLEIEDNIEEKDRDIKTAVPARNEPDKHNKVNLFDGFLKWSEGKDMNGQEVFNQLLELLKRCIFKLVVCIENYNLLFEGEINGRDVFLQKVVADIERMLKPTGESTFQPFEESLTQATKKKVTHEHEDEEVLQEADTVINQLDHYRKSNIVRDFKLRKIILDQIEKNNKQNVLLPDELRKYMIKEFTTFDFGENRGIDDNVKRGQSIWGKLTSNKLIKDETIKYRPPGKDFRPLENVNDQVIQEVKSKFSEALHAFVSEAVRDDVNTKADQIQKLAKACYKKGDTISKANIFQLGMVELTQEYKALNDNENKVALREKLLKLVTREVLTSVTAQKQKMCFRLHVMRAAPTFARLMYLTSDIQEQNVPEEQQQKDSRNNMLKVIKELDDFAFRPEDDENKAAEVLNIAANRDEDVCDDESDGEPVPQVEMTPIRRKEIELENAESELAGLTGQAKKAQEDKVAALDLEFKKMKEDEKKTLDHQKNEDHDVAVLLQRVSLKEWCRNLPRLIELLVRNLTEINDSTQRLLVQKGRTSVEEAMIKSFDKQREDTFDLMLELVKLSNLESMKLKSPKIDQFQKLLKDYDIGDMVSFGEEAGEENMNIFQICFLTIIKILRNPNLLKIDTGKQAQFVELLCAYMIEQSNDLRVRGTRCDIIKGDIKPEDGKEQDAYEMANFQYARLVYSFLFAFFQWDTDYHLSIKKQVKLQIQRQMYRDGLHDSLSALDMEVDDDFLMQQVGKELSSATKIKRELLQFIDQYAEMLFTIKKCHKTKDTDPVITYSNVEQAEILEELKEIRNKWDPYTKSLPPTMNQDWDGYCDIDLHTQMFFQILSCFNVDNMMDLIEKKVGISGKQTMRKKLRTLLSILLDNMPYTERIQFSSVKLFELRTTLEYKDVFEQYGRELRQAVLSNFYFQMCHLLIDIKQTKVDQHIEAFRPIFVSLWLLMLQNFITERGIEVESQRQKVKDEIARLKAKIKKGEGRFVNWIEDENDYPELQKKFKDFTNADVKAQRALVERHIKEKNVERNETYMRNSGGSFDLILKFWLKACQIDSTKNILIPSDSLVMKFRQQMIPQLVVIAQKEQFLDSYHSMQHILQLLFFYNLLTLDRQKEDPFDPKLIELLPVMFRISERLIKDKDAQGYRREALTYGKWLKCKSKLNPSCHKEKQKDLMPYEVKDTKDKCGYDDNEQSPLAKEITAAQQTLFNQLHDSTVHFDLQALIDNSMKLTSVFMEVERRLFIKYMAEVQYMNKAGGPQYELDDDIRTYNEKSKAKREAYNVEKEKLQAAEENEAKKKEENKETNQEAANNEEAKNADGQKEDKKEESKAPAQPPEKKPDAPATTQEDAAAKQRDESKKTEELEKAKKEFEEAQKQLESRLISVYKSVNHYTRPADLLHLSYSRFMLIKKKLDHEIYDQAAEIFRDVIDCQKDLRKLQTKLKEKDEDDSDDDIDETRNFLATEIPLIMHQALEWMNKKMEQKQKDRIWMDNFVKDCHFNVFEEYQKVSLSLEQNVFEQKFSLKELSEVNQEELRQKRVIVDVQDIYDKFSKNLKLIKDYEELTLRVKDKKEQDEQMNNWKEEHIFTLTDLADLTRDSHAAEQIFSCLKIKNNKSDSDDSEDSDSDDDDDDEEQKKEKIGKPHYPFQAFGSKLKQAKKLIHQDKLIQSRLQKAGQLSKESKKRDIMKEKSDEAIEKLKNLSIKITSCDEQKLKNKTEMPNYCSYFHLQFWGRQFSPELTHSENGFMIRRKFNQDLQTLSKEMRIIYKDCTFVDKNDKEKPVEIISRTTPFTSPVWKNPVEDPGHNQLEPKIAMVFNIRTLTKEIVKLFYGQTHAERSESDQRLFYGFEMEKNNFDSKRDNFKEFFENNYKQYFYCVDREQNELIKMKAEKSIAKVLEEAHLTEGVDFLSLNDWKKIDKAIFALRGMPYDTKESSSVWRDLVKFMNQKHEQATKAENDLKLLKEIDQGNLEGKSLQTIEELKQKRADIEKVEKGIFKSLDGKYSKVKLIERLIFQISAQDPFYMDQKLVVLEVPYQFPTGFFMQELEHIHVQRISGARYQNKEIMKEVLTVKQLQEALIAAKESYLQSNNSGKKWDEYKKCVVNLYSQLLPWYNSNINGGAAQWLYKFFPKDSLYPLSRAECEDPKFDREQQAEQVRRFHELLRMFNNLETFFNDMQSGLTLIEAFIQECDDSSDHKLPQAIARKSTTIWQKTQDELIDLLEQCRAEHDIDAQLAVERDKMISEGTDELDDE